MTLWDAEIGQFETELLECSDDALRTLGLKAIEGTTLVFGRPLEDLFDQSTVRMIRTALEEFREFSEYSEEVEERWSRLFEHADAWKDEVSPFTAASITQALVQYADYLADQDDRDELIEALSSCYESVLSFAQLGRVVTLEAERGNEYCQKAIELQKTLLEQVCGIS